MQQISLFIFFLFLVSASKAQQQETYIKEGNTFFKKGQLAEAVSSYNKVTDAPLKYTALLNKGTALYKQKKYEDAVKTYKQVWVNLRIN